MLCRHLERGWCGVRFLYLTVRQAAAEVPMPWLFPGAGSASAWKAAEALRSAREPTLLMRHGRRASASARGCGAVSASAAHLLRSTGVLAPVAAPSGRRAAVNESRLGGLQQFFGERVALAGAGEDEGTDDRGQLR